MILRKMSLPENTEIQPIRHQLAAAEHHREQPRKAALEGAAVHMRKDLIRRLVSEVREPETPKYERK